MEYSKFAARREPYRRALEEIEDMGIPFVDLVHYHTAYAGHMNLARYLALYDAYRKTLGLSGHIAEIGVWKASSLLYFAKLTQIFEPESPTQVHGFDWYKGTVGGEEEKAGNVKSIIQQSSSSQEETKLRTDGEAEALYQQILKLISVQGLDHVAELHKMDVTRELGAFFAKHPHLQFKIVFLDPGTYDCTRASLEHFWPRLTPGGILILDQYNHEISPGETRAVREYIPDVPVHSFVFTNHPTAYIVKPAIETMKPAIAWPPEGSRSVPLPGETILRDDRVKATVVARSPSRVQLDR